MTRLRLRRGSILSDVSQSGSPTLSSVPPIQPFGPGGAGGPGVGPGPTQGINGGNYAETRNVIELTFDDSLDSSFPLECFFQMPTGTLQIYSAKAFIQQKPFRMYSSAASSSSGASSSSASSGHTHNISNNSGGLSSMEGSHTHSVGNTGSEVSHTHGLSPTGTESAVHGHTFSGTDTAGDGYSGTTGNESVNHQHANNATTGAGSSHLHNNPSTGAGSNHQHTYIQPPGVSDQEFPAHTHTITTSVTTTTTLTPGIFESGPTGTFSIFIADDGTTYGSAIATGLTSTPAGGQDLSGQLTKASGDKRLKVTATGLQRVQILVVLDLLIKVTLS